MREVRVKRRKLSFVALPTFVGIKKLSETSKSANKACGTSMWLTSSKAATAQRPTEAHTLRARPPRSLGSHALPGSAAPAHHHMVDHYHN